MKKYKPVLNRLFWFSDDHRYSIRTIGWLRRQLFDLSTPSCYQLSYVLWSVNIVVVTVCSVVLKRMESKNTGVNAAKNISRR